MKAVAADLAAAELAPAARKRMLAGVKAEGEEKGRATDRAAAFYGVAPRSVRQVGMIRRRYPDVYQQMCAGAIELARANRAIQRDRKSKIWKRAAATSARLDAETCRIIVGDCRQVLRGEAPEKIDDESIDLVFTDPPYGIGDAYNGFDDVLSRDELLQLVRGFAEQLPRVLKPHGSALVMMSSRYARHVGNVLEGVGLVDQGPVQWAESFGSHNPLRYTDCHRTIHWFTRHASRFTFNHADTRAYVPSQRAEVYDDARRDGDAKLPGNVWGVWTDRAVARLVDNSPERIPDKIAPNQLPVKLVERIVLLHSNPGDVVLDAFHGTGTTARACLPHGRRYVGVEIDRAVAERSKQWIRAWLGGAGRRASKTEAA
jgi:site-specific DNA-methyltransferase (adenine-specific)